MRRLLLCLILTSFACSGSDGGLDVQGNQDSGVITDGAAQDANTGLDVGADAGLTDQGIVDSGDAGAVDTGAPADTGVGPKNPVSWSFMDAWTLTADHFEMNLDGERFLANVAGVTFNSNPNMGPSFSLVIEVEWAEGTLTDQRLYIYLDSDGINWSSDEVRAYGTDGDWIYFDAPVPLFGAELGTDVAQPELRLSVAGRGEILFENVVIRPTALCPTCMWMH